MFVCTLLVLVGGRRAEQAQAPAGDGLQLNTSDLSVSGLSAGAFMAVQFHVS